MVRQLNIFIENKPGRLKAVTEVLLAQQVNIRAFTIQDRRDFGLMKLLVNIPQQAYLVLADKGYACALKDVVALSIKDKPGNLHKLLSLLAQHNINISDTYGFVLEPQAQGVCCLEVDNPQELEILLQKEGFTVLQEEQLNTF